MCNWVYSNCIILCICVVIYPPIGSIENLTWVIVFMVFLPYMLPTSIDCVFKINVVERGVCLHFYMKKTMFI